MGRYSNTFFGINFLKYKLRLVKKIIVVIPTKIKYLFSFNLSKDTDSENTFFTNKLNLKFCDYIFLKFSSCLDDLLVI